MDTLTQYLKDERVLLGITAAVVGLSLIALSQRRRKPPGPAVWPVVGSLPSLREDLAVFKEFAEKYGDICYLELGLFGSSPTIVLNSIELIREALLKKQDDFAGRKLTPLFDMFSENGKDIVMGDFNETWRYERKIAHMALRKYATGHQFQNLMERNVEMISEVFQKAGSEPVDIYKLSSLVFYNVIASLCFGKNYGLDDPEFNRIRKLIDDANDSFTGLFLSDLHPMFQYIPTPSYRMLNNMAHEIFDFVNSFITEHKKTFDENDLRDFTDYIIHSEKEMKATGLAEYQVEITDTHIRQILIDMFFGGYEVPKGTQVMVNLMHVHTNPKHFPDPLKFDPDRFLDEVGNLAPKPAAFLPFSTGRRQCVGEAFAKSELHVIFGMLLQRFTFSPPEGKTIDFTPKKNMFLYLPLDDQTQLIVKERI